MKKASPVILFSLLVIAVLLSLPYLLEPRFDFDADEAIVGLMALHTTRGRIPVYFYGQGYMGSLEALLAAVFFLFLGPSPGALKLAPMLFYLLFLLLQFKLISTYKDLPHALLTLAFTVIFSPVISLWATKARGGFTAVLFWGVLAYWLFFKTMDNYLTGDRTKLRWAILTAAAAAVSFWHFPLVGYYYLPILMVTIYLVFHDSAAQVFLFSGYIEVKEILNWPGRKGKAWRGIIRLLAGIWVAWFLFSLAALISGGIYINVAGVRISSHHGGRDLFRALASAVLSIAALFVWRFGWKDLIRRLTFARSRLFASPALVAALALSLIPVLFLVAINNYFSLLPDSEYGAGRPLGPIAVFHDLPGTASLIFASLIPYVTSLRSCFSSASGVKPVWGIFRVFFMAIAVVLPSLTVFPRLFSRLVSRPQRLEAFFLTSLFGSLFVLWLSGAVQDFASFRYLIPLASWLPYLYAVAVINLFRRHRSAGLIVGAVLAASHLFSFLPTLDTYKELAIKQGRESAPEAVIRILDEENVDRVYADYWLAYPITFLSRERIIAAPYLSWDRYPPYTSLVENSGRKAYVFEAENIAEAQRLRKQLAKKGETVFIRHAAGKQILIVSPTQ